MQQAYIRNITLTKYDEKASSRKHALSNNHTRYLNETQPFLSYLGEDAHIITDIGWNQD